ncbi:glutathione S-transferase family protein [Massilia sp. PWRC2]|uniref:glutathione S-transferase family protein n=1 Tax=Massilia sp. PWRC2 TaxID=2804626 RepID=UPI003CF9088B
MNRHVTLYYAPQSRALGALALLEELGADYTLQILNLKTGQQRQPAYLAINPMGKVPAIVHDGALVTEQPAIYQYLAELYPEAQLSPAPGTSLRGPYLRWLAFYGSSFEPALLDKALQRAPGAPSTVPYGDYDTTIKVLTDQLEHGSYLLGDTITAADLLWGVALAWTVAFKMVPDTPRIRAYIERIEARPSVQRARAREAEILATLN